MQDGQIVKTAISLKAGDQSAFLPAVNMGVMAVEIVRWEIMRVPFKEACYRFRFHNFGGKIDDYWTIISEVNKRFMLLYVY